MVGDGVRQSLTSAVHRDIHWWMVAEVMVLVIQSLTPALHRVHPLVDGGRGNGVGDCRSLTPALHLVHLLVCVVELCLIVMEVSLPDTSY